MFRGFILKEKKIFKPCIKVDGTIDVRIFELIDIYNQLSLKKNAIRFLKLFLEGLFSRILSSVKWYH